MIKAASYLIATLVLTSFLFSSVSLGQNTSSVVVASSGSVTPISHMKLNNAIVIYGSTSLNSTEMAVVANNFSMLICDFDMSPATLQSLKSLNPNLLIFGYCNTLGTYPAHSYWNTVNSHEDWFVHNLAGNRIKAQNYGWYMLNPASLGWKQFYCSYVNSKLDGTLFDGVFADDVWNQISVQISWSNFLVDATTMAPIRESDMPNDFLSNWHSNVISFLQYVKGNIISGKKVIVNTDEYLTNDYLNIVDGKMNENFAYFNNYPLNKHEEISWWYNPIDHINAMITSSATGKIFIAVSGVAMPATLNASTAAEIARNAKYCYAATLLGVNGPNCYFGYNVGEYYTFDCGAYYIPTLVKTFGAPTASYYKNQGVYMRDFTGGIVLFNPSANYYNVTLGKNYYLTNGTILSSIILSPWSGEILSSQL